MSLILSEDISAHWVAVLFLVDIWTQKRVPECESNNVLTFLVQIIEGQPMEMVSLKDQQPSLIIIPTLNDLLRQLKSPVTEKLLKEVCFSVNTVEDLEFKVAAVGECICAGNLVTSEEGIKILPSSFLGRFVTKVVTTYSLLQFDESLLLYESFISYRERKSGRSSMKSNGSYKMEGIEEEEDETNFEDVQHSREDNQLKELNFNDRDQRLFKKLNEQLSQLSIGNYNSNNLVNIPKHDLERLLAKQIQLLETNGIPTPTALKDILTRITSAEGNNLLIQNAELNNLPQWSYIQYLEALESSDYHTATQALHQYFDYMVSNNSKYFYHFALILRAALHQHFGENERALDAIEEAISVARENKDNSTLTYILSWLFNFMRNKPQLWRSQPYYYNESHLLEFLIARSQFVSLPLYSISYQFETLHILNSGGTFTTAFESLIKSIYISLHDEDTNTLVKCLELASSVWNRVGSSHMAQVYFEIEVKRNLADIITLDLRKAYFSYENGNIDQTYSLIENLRKRTIGDRILMKQVHIRSLILQTRINLYRGRHILASKQLELLMNSGCEDSELNLELIYLNAEAQLIFKNYSNAINYISKNLLQFEQRDVPSNSHIISRLRLLKAKVFVQAESSAKALSLVINEIRMAKKLGILSLIVEGVIVLASVLNQLGTYEDVYDLLETSMPNIILVGNVDFIAHAYHEFAKCCWQLINKLGSTFRGKKLLGKFLKFLNLAIDGFKKQLNLIMLQKCFELEQEMANAEGLGELEDHAINSLQKLEIRLNEEVNYGFCNA